MHMPTKGIVASACTAVVGGMCFGGGLGITLFGMAYVFVHDGLVHRCGLSCILSRAQSPVYYIYTVACGCCCTGKEN